MNMRHNRVCHNKVLLYCNLHDFWFDTNKPPDWLIDLNQCSSKHYVRFTATNLFPSPNIWHKKHTWWSSNSCSRTARSSGSCLWSSAVSICSVWVNHRSSLSSSLAFAWRSSSASPILLSLCLAQWTTSSHRARSVTCQRFKVFVASGCAWRRMSPHIWRHSFKSPSFSTRLELNACKQIKKTGEHFCKTCVVRNLEKISENFLKKHVEWWDQIRKQASFIQLQFELLLWSF